jgi:hypothetical protein
MTCIGHPGVTNRMGNATGSNINEGVVIMLNKAIKKMQAATMHSSCNHK